ncbi:MAG: amidohydrolase family protein, partial [Geopsychrobacter sp.]|nr:amidohydrolase family protein [Geopsychrobacter sp.]
DLAFASEISAADLGPAELVAMATRDGAAALGLSSDLGELAPGMRCSFQVVGGGSALRARGLVDALICEGQGQQIAALILDGTVVKQP